MFIDLSCPVENLKSTVKTNSETGEQYLLLKLLNISEKTITSINLNVKVYDANGTNICDIPLELTEISAAPKTFFAENKAISLNDVPDAKNFVVEVTYATFEEEEPYAPSEENTIEYDNSEASIENALALRTFVPEAVCFAEENHDHWKCVCGRPNFLDSVNCVRCGNSKEEMLEKFSSENSLQEAIKKAEIEKEQKALEEAYEKEQILKAKKAKIKKILITSAITLASLIILFVAGFFIRNLCYNMIAKSARDNGDYAKAYSLYAKTGSSKIGEITKAVQGNTPSNLVSGGISTEDKDNLYFLAYDSTTGGYNLIKENKASKERLTLTDDTLGELNVSGDYIYYLNSEKKVWRTRKDGTSSELVVDKEAFLMTVIGNDIFYITTEFDNPNNLSYEQCQLLAAQGQMDAFYRIRKFNIDSKKDTMISEDNVSSFSVYKDKIYFLTMGEDTTKSSFLKSMSLDGKNVENVIDVPVYSYLIHGDEIYYIKIFTGDPASGNISYSLAKKNLKTGKNEDLYPGTAIFDLNATEDNLLYISVNYQDYMNSYSNPDAEPATISLMSLDFKTNSEKVLVSGNLRYFNISGDSIFLVTDEGIFRLNVDGTGFAPIYGDGSSVSTVEEQEVSEENQ